MLNQVVIWPQFQNFTLKCCFLACRRASENADCYPKPEMGQKKYFHVFEACARGNVFFGFLTFFKSKNEETPKLIFIYFSLVPVKNPFTHFGGLN